MKNSSTKFAILSLVIVSICVGLIIFFSTKFAPTATVQNTQLNTNTNTVTNTVGNTVENTVTNTVENTVNTTNEI